MKKRLKSIILSKQRGDGELITNAFTLFIIAVMLMFFLCLYTDMKWKDNLDLVGRKYILIMETTNTLDVDDLLVELDLATGGRGDGNYRNWLDKPRVMVTVLGTDRLTTDTVTGGVYEIPAQYGDYITLKVIGDIKIKTGKWVSLGNVSGTKTAHVVIEKSSTSKH